MDKPVCPACRYAQRKGISIADCSAVPDYVNFPALKQRRLALLKSRLDEKFGTDAIKYGSAPYEGSGVPREFICNKDPSHGAFVTKPKNLLRLQIKLACPKCRMALLESYCAPSEVRGKGGYIYLIEDVCTGMKYVGITASTPEIRFIQHKQAAVKNPGRPLYQALQARPEEFQLTPLAYYYELTDLAQAEKEAIVAHGSRWPNGYNLSDGGEIGGRPVSGRSPGQAQASRTDKQLCTRPSRQKAKNGESAEFREKCRVLRVCHKRIQLRMRQDSVSFEEAVARHEDMKRESGWTCTKVSSLVVNGVEYTDGINKACQVLGVPRSKVNQLVKDLGVSRDRALEMALTQKAENEKRAVTGPSNKLEIRVNGTRYACGFEAACKALKISVNRVRAIMKEQAVSHSAAIELALKPITCRGVHPGVAQLAA